MKTNLKRFKTNKQDTERNEGPERKDSQTKEQKTEDPMI